MNVYRNIETPKCNNCCSGKTMSVTYSECVFLGLGIQHAMRMRRVILSSVPCLAVPCYLVKAEFSGENVKMCFDFLTHFV